MQMKWNNFVVDFYAIRKNKQINKYLTIWFKLLCMCMYVYTHTHIHKHKTLLPGEFWSLFNSVKGKYIKKNAKLFENILFVWVEKYL